MTVADPDQLELFPPIAGRTCQVQLHLDYPAAADAPLVKRLEGAVRRLRRGAVVSVPKLKLVVRELEVIAGLFDGQ